MGQKKNHHFVLDYVIQSHRHALRHLKLWFIPHEANNHHPHAIRPKALRFYSALLLVIKASTVVFFFVAYPNPAHFAALTTEKMIEMTNQSRVEAGLPVLSTHPRLSQAAQKKADDMIKKGYFAHTSPDGSRFFTWIQSAGYNYALAGENLAMDFTSAESAHTALMNSASHKENILNTKYVHVGMAVVSGVIDGKSTIILVEMFGTPYVAPTTTVATNPEPPKTSPTPAPVVTQPEKKPAVTQTPTPPVTTPTPTPTPAPPAVLTEAKIAAQSTETLQIQQEESTSLSVTFENSGTTTWDAGTKLSFEAVDKSNPENKITPEPIAIGQAVAPGKAITLSFTFDAPGTPGDYTLTTFLAKDSGKVVGSEAFFAVLVNQKPPVTVASNAVISEENASPIQLAQAEQGQKEVLTPVEYKNQGIISTIAQATDKFFFGFVVFLGALLTLNLLVRMRIQHGHVIAEVILVMAIASLALLTKISILETIGTYVKVI